MSYILEALKKSESERNRGRVPDLGQQIRMIHRKRKRGIPAAVWLALALLANAVVLAVLFWPGVGMWSRAPEPIAAVTEDTTVGPDNSAVPAEVSTNKPQPEMASHVPPTPGTTASAAADPVPTAPQPVPEPEPEFVNQAPTVIVPTVREPLMPGAEELIRPWQGRVPHLVEMPMAFQRNVPDLVFNSHVYASDPRDRRIMINGSFLRKGESLGPLTVELITEDGVVLSMNGERFRIGVVRNWSSPR